MTRGGSFIARRRKPTRQSRFMKCPVLDVLAPNDSLGNYWASQRPLFAPCVFSVQGTVLDGFGYMARMDIINAFQVCNSPSYL